MTDPSTDPRGPDDPRLPGERRLAHPPSDRYRAPEPVAPTRDMAQSAARGTAYAVVAGIAGAAAIVVLGGVLAVSAGLLVIAGATGWAVAVGLRVGAGDRIAPSRRTSLAIGLALAAVAIGQAGLWLYARSEGGVLGPLDYLGEVYGPLVPLQLLLATIVAWVSAR